MKRLELLDYGRFFAAIIVILFHYTFNGIQNGKLSSLTHVPTLIEFTKYGFLGVELFFMISGFVIFNSAHNRTSAQFVVSRALRLYPSYWFAIVFTAFFTLFWGGDLMSVETIQVLVNFSMFQSNFGIANVDGVYWTLVYELEFYFGVFLLLLFGLQKHLDKIAILWPILMVIALVTDRTWIPFLGGYFYYFSAGVLFALAKTKPNLITYLSLMISFSLCQYFTLGTIEQLIEIKEVHYSYPVIAFIITIFFVFFISLNVKRWQSLKLPFSSTMGALTYPIYLIHAHFGYMFLSRFATDSNKMILYPITLLIVLLVAYLMHKIIEVQLATTWRKLFTRTLGKGVKKLQSLMDFVFNGLRKTIN